jgi:hypothetical protein
VQPGDPVASPDAECAKVSQIDHGGSCAQGGVFGAHIPIIARDRDPIAF